MTDAPDAPSPPAETGSPARRTAPAHARARSVATSKPDPDHGRFTPAWFGQAVRRVASALPANRTGLRLSGALDDVVEIRRISPVTASPGADGESILGVFRVLDAQGTSRLLRICDEKRMAVLVAADAVVRGIRVEAPALIPVIEAGWPRALDDGVTAALLMPFVEGRYPRSDLAELERIGRALGALHHALAGHPDRLSIAARAAERDSALVALWPYSVLEVAPASCVVLLRALSVTIAVPSLKNGNPQPLHGDLNPGNILVTAERGIAFLDFENVRHSCGPVVLDLAMLVERLCRMSDDGRVNENALSALVSGYARAAGRSADTLFPAGELHRALVARNVKALCILAAKQQSGHPVDEAEWLKFVLLLQAAGGLSESRSASASDAPRGAAFPVG
jgi:Ser/Thr protein kinase RdoA (MazF antagonist)